MFATLSTGRTTPHAFERARRRQCSGARRASPLQGPSGRPRGGKLGGKLEAMMPIGPTSATFPMIDGYLAAHPWAQSVVDVQLGVRDKVSHQLEPLQLQPTRYTADGVLRVPLLDDTRELKIESYSGPGVVRHAFMTCLVTPAYGTLYTKSEFHACMEQATPLLTLELGGNEQRTLLMLGFAPRLSMLAHPSYTKKYYRSTPPGSPASLLPFTAVYNRMLGRAQNGTGLTTAVSHLKEQAVQGAPLLYRTFSSEDINTRLYAGSSALFTFDPCDPSAVSAVREDVKALVELWCAWAREDWKDGKGPAVPAELRAECLRTSRAVTNPFEEEEAAKVARIAILGEEGARQMTETCSGVASLAGAPWWMEHTGL